MEVVDVVLKSVQKLDHSFLVVAVSSQIDRKLSFVVWKQTLDVVELKSDIFQSFGLW